MIPFSFLTALTINAIQACEDFYTILSVFINVLVSKLGSCVTIIVPVSTEFPTLMKASLPSKLVAGNHNVLYVKNIYEAHYTCSYSKPVFN